MWPRGHRGPAQLFVSIWLDRSQNPVIGLVYYTRQSFRASQKRSVSLLSTYTSGTRLLSHIPSSANRLLELLFGKLLSWVAKLKLFIKWCPLLYFHVSGKHLTLRNLRLILPDLICLADSYIRFKRAMSLGIKIHQGVYNKKIIGKKRVGGCAHARRRAEGQSGCCRLGLSDS